MTEPRYEVKVERLPDRPEYGGLEQIGQDPPKYVDVGHAIDAETGTCVSPACADLPLEDPAPPANNDWATWPADAKCPKCVSAIAKG